MPKYMLLLYRDEPSPRSARRENPRRRCGSQFNESLREAGLLVGGEPCTRCTLRRPSASQRRDRDPRWSVRGDQGVSGRPLPVGLRRPRRGAQAGRTGAACALRIGRGAPGRWTWARRRQPTKRRARRRERRRPARRVAATRPSPSSALSARSAPPSWRRSSAMSATSSSPRTPSRMRSRPRWHVASRRGPVEPGRLDHDGRATASDRPAAPHSLARRSHRPAGRARAPGLPGASVGDARTAWSPMTGCG